MKFMIYDHNNSLNQCFWKVHFCQVWWVVFILFFSSVEFINLYFIHQRQRGWGDNFHLLMMSHSSTDATMGWNNFWGPLVINISSVVEFQRWLVLKSKVFGQESTYSNFFQKILWWITVRQKVPKSYFQSQFSMSKINRFFSKKNFI